MMTKITPEIAEICGAFIGDGWVETRGNAIYITGHPKEDKEYFDNNLSPLFSKNFQKVSPRAYSYWGVYGFGLYKKEVINRIIELGMQKGNKASTVKFPKWAFSSKKIMKSILRGLFDTDGCVSCEKNYSLKNPKYHTKIKIHIVSISPNLIKEANKILNKLEIKNFIKKPYQQKQKNCKLSHRIVIDGGINVDKWFKLIGSSNPKHITKYQIWKKYNFCPPFTTLDERKRILNGENPYNYYECGRQGSNLRRH